MTLPRRHFLHLAASAAALPAVSRIAWAQVYPSRPISFYASPASPASLAAVQRKPALLGCHAPAGARNGPRLVPSASACVNAEWRKLHLRIVFVKRAHEHADAPHAVALLRARRQRPRRRAPEPCNELPPPHPSSPEAALSIAYRSWGCMSGLEAEVRRSFFCSARGGLWPILLQKSFCTADQKFSGL
jgi:hypothetical protein